MKHISSKRAKALAISEETKEKVWCRDAGRCVWCRLHPEYWTGYKAYPEAHLIPRPKGGLGIPENVLTLCRPHHDELDHSMRSHRAEMRQELIGYLKHYYPDWEQEKVIYHKEGL